jgi:hypothetical protein
MTYSYTGLTLGTSHITTLYIGVEATAHATSNVIYLLRSSNLPNLRTLDISFVATRNNSKGFFNAFNCPQGNDWLVPVGLAGLLDNVFLRFSGMSYIVGIAQVQALFGPANREEVMRVEVDSTTRIIS